EGTAEPEDWRARYNVAPTQRVVVVRATPEGGRELTLLRWGLIPSRSKDPTIGSRLFNARAETVAEKPSYRAAVKARRCLIPAGGVSRGGRKNPGAACPRGTGSARGSRKSRKCRT